MKRHLNLISEKLNITHKQNKNVESKFTLTYNFPLKFEDQMTVELCVMESFTLLCKVCSVITLSDRIILKIAVLVEYA